MSRATHVAALQRTRRLVQAARQAVVRERLFQHLLHRLVHVHGLIWRRGGRRRLLLLGGGRLLLGGGRLLGGRRLDFLLSAGRTLLSVPSLHNTVQWIDRTAYWCDAHVSAAPEESGLACS